MFPLITSGIKGPIKLEFGTVKFKNQTSNTQKQTSVQLFHILSSCCAWPDVEPEMYVALQLFKKIFFLH